MQRAGNEAVRRDIQPYDIHIKGLTFKQPLAGIGAPRQPAP